MITWALLLIFATRSICWSPTDSYAPGNVSCPAVDSLVRPATGISDSEKSWTHKRHDVTNKNLIKFLTHSLQDFDSRAYIDLLNESISIGVAFSGGGYRAMFAGAGQLAALDNRTQGAWEHGLGGLIESTTYFAGLSGGNWLLGTVAYNNWTSVEQILENGTIWDLEESNLLPGGFDFLKTDAYWDEIFDQLDEKKKAGFDISLTDPWGRALSTLFFPSYFQNGSALTVSTLRDSQVFKNHQMPLPIHVSVGRTPGSVVINLNSTVFESTPFELGSWDPSLYAFTDIKYLGTNVSNGVPTTDNCIGGFDNAGFIMGTSSSLFNSVTDLNSSSLGGELLLYVKGLGYSFTEEYYNIALYKPNPFRKTNYTDVEAIVDADTLYLADGGEDGEGIPFAPLIQQEREVDIIFAFDNSGDTLDDWPNGSAMVNTYDRQFSKQGNGTAFPYVPPPETFIALNLTHKPVFFGCDAKNLTSLNKDLIPPLIVYIANTNISYLSNTSTLKLSYTEQEKRGMIQNGFETASRANMTLDSNWRSCVSCAIIRRSEERHGIKLSKQCQSCFDEYCWDGSLK